MKTYMKTKKDLKDRKWHICDANGKVLGRMATKIADTLRGKNKVDYTPHIDSGDFVVVINASSVKLTGDKMQKKIYYRHTGHMGGLKRINAEDLLKKHPGELVMKAVKGMLPKTKLGRAQIKKLKIYAGAEHPHIAQKPVELKL